MPIWDMRSGRPNTGSTSYSFEAHRVRLHAYRRLNTIHVTILRSLILSYIYHNPPPGVDHILSCSFHAAHRLSH